MQGPLALTVVPDKEEDKSLKPPTLGLKVKVLRVHGKLEASVVQKAMEENLTRLEKCYREAQEQGNKLPILVNVKITINGDGKVTAARVINKAKLPSSLEKCLVEALKGVAFPKLAQDKAEAEIQLTLPTPQRS